MWLAPIATVEYLEAALSLPNDHGLGMAITKLDLTHRPACCIELAKNYGRSARRASRRPARCAGAALECQP
jgi:hypothetical protein